MRLSISGTQCIGKSTYIQDFLNVWTNYTTPNKSYRDVIKKQNLTHSSHTTEETQTAIMNFLIDLLKSYSKKDNVIFDRCPLDAMAYTSWLYLKGGCSEAFLDEARLLVRESLKMLDIIFFLPITKAGEVKIIGDGLRDIDPIHREEIDNIFKEFGQTYAKGTGVIFPTEDCPAFIELFGNQDERIAMTKMYLNEQGQPYGEEHSLLSDSLILPPS